MDARGIPRLGQGDRRQSRLPRGIARYRRGRRRSWCPDANGGVHTMRTPDKLDIAIPDFSLVVLIGASGSGKSTFAAKHFLPTEIISSDKARGLVSDNETDQGVTADAFELVRAIAEKRLKNRRLAVIDATNVR